MTMPEFLTPERLWALLVLPALIIAYLVAIRFRSRKGIRFTNTGLLDRVAPRKARWVRHLAVAMSLFSLTALVLAWAQPLGIDKVPRERATVVLIIDTSRSMAATDVKPDRLSAAKLAAIEFMKELPEEYNLSVVELSGNPAIRVPPTTDRGVAQRAIEALTFQDGTAIGDALNVGLRAIKQAPAAKEKDAEIPAMMVLLSDGTSTEGIAPDDAVAKAKTRKVPIYTIAYGTANGYVDLDGKRERVAPNKRLLQQIAKVSGGEGLSANSASRLNSAYKEIGSVIGYEEVKKPVTANYAFWSLGFAIVAALGAVMMASRWP